MKGYLVVLIVALAVIGAGVYFFAPSFGATDQTTLTNPTFVDSAQGGKLKVGTNGSQLTGIQVGTCTITAYATTIVATSSALVDCSAGVAAVSPISGITSGDKVFVTLASTTVLTSQGGLLLNWAAASTTDGYIRLSVYNNSGTTFTWASTASSSIRYLVIR